MTKRPKNTLPTSKSQPVGRPRRPAQADTFAGAVGANVRRMREKLGLSVEQCAYRARVSVATWYRLEAGSQPKTAGLLVDRAARILGVTAAELSRT